MGPHGPKRPVSLSFIILYCVAIYFKTQYTYNCVYCFNMSATGKYAEEPQLRIPIQDDPTPLQVPCPTPTTTFNDFLQELLRHSYTTQSSYNSMERSRTAAFSAKRRWELLQECLLEQVLPNTLCSYRDSNAHGLAFPKHHEAMLRDQLDALRFEKQAKFAQLHQSKVAFRLHCPEHLYLQGLKFAHARVRERDIAHVAKLANKLRRLCDSSTWSKASLRECVVNKSSHVLTKHEEQLLGLGLSFSLLPRSEAVVDVLAAIQDLEAKAKDIVPEINTIKGYALTGLNQLTKPRGGLARLLQRGKQSLQDNQDFIIMK